MFTLVGDVFAVPSVGMGMRPPSALHVCAVHFVVEKGGLVERIGFGSGDIFPFRTVRRRSPSLGRPLPGKLLRNCCRFLWNRGTQSIHIDEVSLALGARLLVIPRFCSLTAFYVNAGTFVKAVANDLRLPTEGFHGEPFGVFLQLAVFTPRPFRSRCGGLRDGCTLLAVVHSGSRPRYPINITFCIADFFFWWLASAAVRIAFRGFI
jgi:hypothetical protein